MHQMIFVVSWRKCWVILNLSKFISITVHSNDFASHSKHISIVFDKLRQHNLKLNATKCKWFQQNIKILGFMISQNHFEMDLEKIRVVKEWPSPKNDKELSRFIGFCTYFVIIVVSSINSRIS